MYGYLFSRYLNSIFKSHIRNIFFRDDITYIFPCDFKLPSCIDYVNKENMIFYKNEDDLTKILLNFNTVILCESFNLRWYVKHDHHIEKLKSLNLIFIAHGLHVCLLYTSPSPRD